MAGRESHTCSFLNFLLFGLAFCQKLSSVCLHTSVLKGLTRYCQFLFHGLCSVCFSPGMWSLWMSYTGCYLHGSSGNTSRNQMEKIETSAFLCMDYVEIFTPTHLNQICSGEVWLLAWARKLLFQAALHENFRLGLPVCAPLWAVFLSCSKEFLWLICCPCGKEELDDLSEGKGCHHVWTQWPWDRSRGILKTCF